MVTPWAARFFYKRYRSLLSALLEGSVAAPDGAPASRPSLETLLGFFDEPEADVLRFLAPVAPPALRPLLPEAIERLGEDGPFDEAALPTELDRRLWRFACRHEADAALERIGARIDVLERTAMFRPLPAEILLELAQRLRRVPLRDGEPLILEGDTNGDLFLVAKGALVTRMGHDPAARPVHRFHEGDTFGEIAFLTGRPRVATVSAEGPAECLALSGDALRALIQRHPEIAIRLGQVVSQRLGHAEAASGTRDGPAASSEAPSQRDESGGEPVRLDRQVAALGQQLLGAFRAELQSYGIGADPALELRDGSGMLCYYDLTDGHIYLATPDLGKPIGKLQLLFMREALGCENDEELALFLRMFLPYLVGHELGHHLRHRHGLFGDSLWHEEQVANQLAIALTKHRLSPQLRAFARQALPRTLARLEEKLGIQGAAVDTYHDVLQALCTSGQIEDSSRQQIELVQRLFARRPEEILEQSGELSAQTRRRLEGRTEVIGQIDRDYASDFQRYLYYHLGWLHLGLAGRENHYVDAFARTHLRRRTRLLPVPPGDGQGPAASDRAIQACHKAYLDTAPRSAVAGAWFQGRLRTLVASRRRPASAGDPAAWPAVGPSDLAQTLADPIDPRLALQDHLPSETDVRIWRHIRLDEPDDEAAATLSTLAVLLRAEAWRALPSEALLDLSHQSCRLRLAAGETIIHEGDRNADVYLVLAGRLEATMDRDGRPLRLGDIGPGEAFGEMAFFTHEARRATVRASEPAECLVLRDTDLRVVGTRHPAVLERLAARVAERWADIESARPPEPMGDDR